MKFSKKQIIIIAGGAVLSIVLIYLVAANIRPKPTVGPSLTLNLWGLDDKSAMSKIIGGYQKLRPTVKVNYQQFSPADYENQLLEAMASGQSPDIFYIGNHGVPKSLDRIVAVSPTQFNLSGIRSLFPAAVEQDFVQNGTIYALPLYMDTMALIYNKDYFNQAAIVYPPKTWNDFQNDVKILRVISPNGQIARAGAALGGSEKTVDAGVDLINLLMLQNGTQMIPSNFQGYTPQGFGDSGLAAFNFYLQFVNSTSPYYTWNEGQGNSLDSFAGGKTAMILNYQSAISVIQSKGPYINLAVAPMPQPTGAKLDVNYPRYYGLVVSKLSKATSWAWDFVIYASTNESAQQAYLGATGRPPALLSLINADLNDLNLGVFAKQALTARSWYIPDDTKVEDSFNSAIENVLSGKINSKVALDQVGGAIGQLLK
ncbi:MAG: extracellular solute-binding protein [Patescibacteria group bacterium]|nr:extracellular solute-binding protein [Patescibacteria group bacterium]MDE2015197.1 extracellular solute-binding protein [Patescibacteria group bacterium]MDE2226624.1 extracellular solute-binding protein [Patescibacteria group bacterium]